MRKIIATLVLAISAALSSTASTTELVYKITMRGTELYSSGGTSSAMSRSFSRSGYVCLGYSAQSGLFSKPVMVVVDIYRKTYGLTEMSSGSASCEVMSTNSGEIFVVGGSDCNASGVVGSVKSAGLSVPAAVRLVGRGAWDRTNTDGSTSVGGASISMLFDAMRTERMNSSGATSAVIDAFVLTDDELPSAVLIALGLNGYSRTAVQIPASSDGSVLSGRTITGGTMDGAVIGLSEPCVAYLKTLSIGEKGSAYVFPTKPGYPGETLSVGSDGVTFEWKTSSYELDTVLNRANHTGYQLSSTISDFEARVKTIVNSMKAYQDSETTDLKARIAELESKLLVKKAE